MRINFTLQKDGQKNEVCCIRRLCSERVFFHKGRNGEKSFGSRRQKAVFLAVSFMCCPFHGGNAMA